MEARPKCAQVNITEAGGMHGSLIAQGLIWMGYTTQWNYYKIPEFFGFILTVISLSKKCKWWYENHNDIGSMNQFANNQLCLMTD